MGLLQFLKTLWTRESDLPVLSYCYPYAEDPGQKRKQLWENLQRGILLEDKGILLPWATPYSGLGRYAERYYPQTKKSKALWQLGRHPVLDGYMLDIGIQRERHQYRDEQFLEASVLLGFGENGLYALRDLLIHLTDRLGHPDSGELGELGDLSVGEVRWRQGEAEICVSAVGQLTVECYLYIRKYETPE